MNIDFLKTFVKIAQLGNLTKVAEELGFSQPAITKQLKALEQEFGAELLERGQKKPRLSEAGLILEMYAGQILSLIEKAKYDITKLNKTVSGKLNIAASSIPGHYILPCIAGEFCKEYPLVHLSFENGDTDEVIKRVLDKSVQIGAVGAYPNLSQLICHRFFTDRLILIASCGHKWSKVEQISVNGLKNGTFIWREKGSGTRKSIENILLSQGIDVSQLNISMELGSTESIVTAVEAGYGVSFVSKWSVQKAIQLGRLKEIEIAGFNGNRDLYLIYLSSDLVPRTVESFVNFANSATVQEKLVNYLNG